MRFTRKIPPLILIISLLFLLSMHVIRAAALPADTYGQYASISDPFDDAQGYTNPDYDAAELTLVRKADTLNITIQTFNSLDSASIGGYIDLDSDQNSLTGEPSHYNTYTQFGTSSMGMDYYVDLFTFDS
jgi:hypothetical protein